MPPIIRSATSESCFRRSRPTAWSCFLRSTWWAGFFTSLSKALVMPAGAQPEFADFRPCAWASAFLVSSAARTAEQRQGKIRSVFRKDLLALLSAEPRSVSSIARALGLRRGDVEDDLRHALRSARAAGHEIVIVPARCRSCGFTFDEEKLSKP